MSKAYDTFTTVFERSKDQVNLYERLVKVRFKKVPNKLSHDDLSDMLRSAVVLGVSSMDMYFTDVFVELLVPFLKKKGATPPLIDFLGKCGLNTEAAIDMAGMTRPYRRVRTIVAKYLDNYTAQREDVVNALFKPYGIAGICAKAQTWACRKNLLTRVRRLTERRHLIVHRGDLNNHGNPNSIDGSDIHNLLEDLELFVGCVDDVLHDKLKL